MYSRYSGSPFVNSHCMDQVEVLDDSGFPLMVMPRQNALDQRLRHSRFAVFLFDAENRMHLHKCPVPVQRSGSVQYLWSISCGHRPAGLSLEEAAIIRTHQATGAELASLELALFLPPCPETQWGELGVFFAPELTAEKYPELFSTSNGMFVDREELSALLEDMPELMSNELAYISSAVSIFELI